MKAVDRNIAWQYMQWHLDKSDKELQQDLAEKKYVHCSLSTIKKYLNELADNKMLASELADNKMLASELADNKLQAKEEE